MMKQMPYRIEEGAIERAKYRAKMAVREAANPTPAPTHRHYALRWVFSTLTIAATLALAVFFYIDSQKMDFEAFVAEMHQAPLDVVNDMTADVIYYAEEENQL